MSTEVWEELGTLTRAHNSCVRKLHAADESLALRVEDLEVAVEEMAQTLESLTTLIARAIPQVA